MDEYNQCSRRIFQSLKRHVPTGLAWGIATLFLLLYETSLWTGFGLGAEKIQAHGHLRMPVGILLAAIRTCREKFSGALAAKVSRKGYGNGVGFRL